MRDVLKVEFLDFVRGLFVIPDFKFVNFNHCLCESPVLKVSKMGCNIGLNSSEILQFKDHKRLPTKSRNSKTHPLTNNRSILVSWHHKGAFRARVN